MANDGTRSWDQLLSTVGPTRQVVAKEIAFFHCLNLLFPLGILVVMLYIIRMCFSRFIFFSLLTIYLVFIFYFSLWKLC